MAEIKATWNPPSKKQLFLVRITGINRIKYPRKGDSYWRVQHYVDDNGFIIASIDETPPEECNVTFEKIKGFSLTGEDINFMFRFFGNEYGANDLQGVRQKLIKDLELCRKKIKESQNAEINFQKLIKEFDEYMSNK